MKCQLMVIAGIAGCGSAQAEIVDIDFNELSLGIVLTDQYEDQGVVFGLVGNAGGLLGPMTVEFPDIDFSPAGGIMLAPTDDNTTNDNWSDIELTFADGGVDWFSMLALDSDEPVSAFAYRGNQLIDSITFSGGGNHQVWDLQLGSVGGPMFDRVVIDLVTTGNVGPEVYDNLSFNRIPAPGALAMVPIGLCVLGRRKRN